MEYYIAIGICGALLIAILAVLYGIHKRMQGSAQLVERLNDMQKAIQDVNQNNAALAARQDLLLKSVEASFDKILRSVSDLNVQNEQKLDNMRRTLHDSLSKLQEDNTRQLEIIRKTVDEKLQDTLEKKLNDSFQLVSERLEQVYKGLGEMQTLANGVGDLKKVLSNVKTRGILGEIQLGAILEQILSPEQYAVNVATKKGSQANVEYAIKLPGDDGIPVWLPIDSKFPIDAYEQLLNAYDSADQQQVDLALKMLKNRVRGFAKDIHDKYIDPPNTTDFAIMFLPTEGLYAELVRAGMVETLQADFKVNIAGPTTMGALLNSLQMGFKTLTIQKRSGEVWKVLSAVKSEFETFHDVLAMTQKHLNQANEDLDKLVGVRTRKIQRTLKDIQSASESNLDELEGID